jgi:Zn-dependent peptidase ImmA (M78 family)/transcriptional regulator with XRE-family HTH domain
MATPSKSKFGNFARKARLERGLGLREAARQMSISAAYLSRVEHNVDVPSGRLIQMMSDLYGVSIDELGEWALRSKATGVAHSHAMQAMPELRALYRLRGQLGPELIEQFLRDFLLERGTNEEDVEKEIAALKLELPRIRNSGRDNMFAAEAKPRFLSRKWISDMAYRVLEQNGLSQEDYIPPTPIELLVDNEPEVSYRIDALSCDKHGAPLVLGLTGWNDQGQRQIILNSVLADSDHSSDEHRFNFTLAHELFHALEHLPGVPKEAAAPLARTQVFVTLGKTHPSPAERAVNRWTRASEPRQLTTDEDWREWQANTFASALLMPEWAVRAEFQRRMGATSTPVEVPANLREAALQLADQRVFGDKVYDQSLSGLFAVSHQAMAIRLLQLNLIKEVAS